MANVNLNIETKGGEQAKKTLGQLEQEAERLNSEIRGVSKNSEEFNKLQKQLKQTNNEIKTVEESFQGMSFEDKGRAIGDVAGGLTQSFGALQTVLASTDGQLNKTINTAVKYIGVAEGVRGAIEATSAGYKLLNTQIKSNIVIQRTLRFVTMASSGAMRVFRGALVATGIGAIIALLGTLIANFGYLKSAVMSAIPTSTINTIKDNFNGLIGFLGDKVSNITDTFKNLGNLIVGVFTADASKVKQSLSELGDGLDENIKKARQQREEQKKTKEQQKHAKQVIKSLNEEISDNNTTLEENQKAQRKVAAELVKANISMEQRKKLQKQLNQLEKEEDELKKERFDKYIENTIDGLKTEKRLAEERGNEQEAINKEIEILQTKQKAVVDGSTEEKLLQEQIKNLRKEQNENELKDELDNIKARIEQLKREEGTQLQILALKEKQADIEGSLADSSLDQAKAETKKKKAQQEFNKQLQRELEITNKIMSGDGIGALEQYQGKDSSSSSATGSAGNSGSSGSGEKNSSLLASALGTDQKSVNKYKSVAQDTTNFIRNLGDKRRQREMRAEKRKLNEQRRQELSNKNLTEAEKDRINKKYDKKAKALDKKQFRRKKKADKQEAIANGATAITKALAQTGGEPVQTALRIALITAKTAKQVSTISNRKYKAAKGGIVQGPSHQAGGVKGTGSFSNIEVEGGEAIINKRATEKYKPLLEKINNSKMESGGIMPSKGSDDTAAEIRKMREENREQTRTMKAYVVENEISSEQAKQERIRRKANLNT